MSAPWWWSRTGWRRKREYRRFKVRTVDQNDDYAAMEEVLDPPALTNYLTDRDKPVAERGKFQYPPQLLMVDGGKGQLNVAIRVLDDLGLSDEIPVCALAKQIRSRCTCPAEAEPIVIPEEVRGPLPPPAAAGTSPTASPSPITGSCARSA